MANGAGHICIQRTRFIRIEAAQAASDARQQKHADDEADKIDEVIKELRSFQNNMTEHVIALRRGLLALGKSKRRHR